ncbi:MAG: toxin-antitoxin system HicB family antitoxin [Eubacterium sp.]|nr:toxin-antitoxin system HicB family antitoxin [Eubacterium sp.]
MNIMTVRAPDDLHLKLKKSAERHGLTRNALILQILWEWVKKQDLAPERKETNGL